MGKSSRPEHTAPPEVFYSEEEARKYTRNSRVTAVQAALTERALELLALPGGPGAGPALLLDLGCGSGLSGAALTDRGHTWVGFDISAAMLDVAQERGVEGDLALGDLGQGLPLRPGAFDGAISISAVQWLCNAERKGQEPRRRLRRFFETLYACLARGARAVLQLYPENPEQASLITSTAMRAGFSGGLVVDFPHSTRAKKFFLVLMVGGSGAGLPQGKTGEEAGEEEGEEGVAVEGRRPPQKKRRGVGSASSVGGSARHPQQRGKAWIHKKKAQARARGVDDVPRDSRYTGRKRKARF